MTSLVGRVGLASVLLLLGACGRGDEETGADSAAKPVVAAATVVVTPQPFTETIGALGQVVVRPGHLAALSAPGPGRVAAVRVAEGERVRAGATLVELEQPPFEAAVSSADAALQAAQRAFERAQRLAEAGVVPRKDLDQATAELEQARLNAAAARRARDLSILRSPLAGVVTRLTATLGASVDANEMLVQVADPDALDIVLDVTAAAAARVRPGASVHLRAGQGPTGDTLGDGVVRDVAAIVDSASRGVAVRIRAARPARPWRIGETVFGDIVVATHRQAIVVPPEALVPAGDGFTVFVVDSSGIAHVRTVTVGGRSAAGAEITQGLAAGERIVTTGAFGVDDGAKIEPAKP